MAGPAEWPTKEELAEDFRKNGPLLPGAWRHLQRGFVLRSGARLVSAAEEAEVRSHFGLGASQI
jgi:hypothetical protein